MFVPRGATTAAPAGHRLSGGGSQACREGRRSAYGRTSDPTSDRARKQQLALAVVVAQVGCASELLARLYQPPQADEQVAAHAGQQVVAAQRGLISERIDELEPRLETEGHRHRHGAVELDDRGTRERGQAVV
jgi:hypothetical protein